MTDPRLEDALHLSQGPLAEGHDTCLCREDAARITATEPGASLLADAAVGKAVRRLEQSAYWKLSLIDGHYRAAASSRVYSGEADTIEAAIAAALGDES